MYKLMICYISNLLTTAGAKQGDLVSFILFSIYIYDSPTVISQVKCVNSVDSIDFNRLLFDIALLAKS